MSHAPVEEKSGGEKVARPHFEIFFQRGSLHVDLCPGGRMEGRREKGGLVSRLCFNEVLACHYAPVEEMGIKGGSEGTRFDIFKALFLHGRSKLLGL